MKNAIENLLDLAKTLPPYVYALVGFLGMVSFGIVKLLAVLESVKG